MFTIPMLEKSWISNFVDCFFKEKEIQKEERKRKKEREKEEERGVEES